MLTLDLPEATPSNNAIKGMHFRAYKTLRQRWWDWWRLGSGRLGMEGVRRLRVHLEIERYSAGGGLDWDNAYGGLKPLLDCLVAPSARNSDGLGLILDDNPRAMPSAPRLTQHAAARGQGRTVLRIFSI